MSRTVKSGASSIGAISWWRRYAYAASYWHEVLDLRLLWFALHNGNMKIDVFLKCLSDTAVQCMNGNIIYIQLYDRTAVLADYNSSTFQNDKLSIWFVLLRLVPSGKCP